MNNLVTAIFGILFSITAIANDLESGWEFIKKNDFVQARTSFETQLEKDSLNKNSLEGLIYIYTLIDDDYNRRKVTRTYLRHHWDEYFYQIYKYYWRQDFNKKAEENLNKFSVKLQTEYHLDKAAQLKRERKFEESLNTYRKASNDMKWSYMGPFQNINGYGHVKDYEVEKSTFNQNYSILNYQGLNIHWVTPTHRNPDGILHFRDHLRTSGSYVAYANTFIDLPEDQEVIIRIARTYPMKIWIDNDLVLDQKDKTNFEIDRERVRLKMKKGSHRILIKYSAGSYFSGKQSFGWNDTYRGLFNSPFTNMIPFMPLASSFYFGGGSSNMNQPAFFSAYGPMVRFTDTKGKVLNLTSSANGEAATQKYAPSLEDNFIINYYNNRVKQEPGNLFNYYLFYKAVMDYDQVSQNEEQFVKWFKANPRSDFFRILLAKVYEVSGKKEKSFQLMNETEINFEKVPIFSINYKKLKEFDPENDEKEYELMLDKMLSITSSNSKLIKDKLTFLDKKGKIGERKEFAQQMIDKYPPYKSMLEKFLKDDYKPTDSNIDSEKDKEKDPNYKKLLKKQFSTFYYNQLINEYKGKGKKSKVISLYKELIEIEPYSTNHREGLAKYLFNKEDYTEARFYMESVLEMDPFDYDMIELLGDTYNDQGDKDKALAYYLKALKISSAGSQYYGSGDLLSKVEKIQGEKKIKEKFNTRPMKEFISDNSWRVKYGTEESVIKAFTQDIYYEAEGLVTVNSQFLIQIITEAGANTWTEYDFSFLGQIDIIKVLKPDGAEVIPDLSGGFVVFKNLEPGDQIQVEASTRFSYNGELGKEMSYFIFTSYKAPVHYAKFEVAIPENLHLSYLHHKLEDNLKAEVKEGMRFHKWEYNGIAKLIQEEAILDGTDVYSSIHLSTLKDWSEVVDWYLAKTYRKFETDYELNNIIQSIIHDTMTKEEKAIAIYNYITKEINYSFTRLLQSNYIPKDCSLTLSSGIGDCKDVATLMISMLRKVGIESYYVLVKTNSYFKQRTMPSLYFDHVITGYVIDGKWNYVDLTTDFYPYYVTNENDIDAWALLVKKGETDVFQLPNDQLNPEKNMVIHTVNATMNKDHSLDVDVESEYFGMRGGYFREMIHRKPREDVKNDILKWIGNTVFENMSLEEFDFQNPREITTPLKSKFKIKATNFSDNVADIYFLKTPSIIGINANVAIFNNERHNTLDLDRLTAIEPTLQKITLKFPKGMRLRAKPKDVNIETEYGIYRCTYKKISGGIYIEKYHQFKKSRISVDEFQKFKKYYTMLLDLEKEKIVMNP